MEAMPPVGAYVKHLSCRPDTVYRVTQLMGFGDVMVIYAGGPHGQMEYGSYLTLGWHAAMRNLRYAYPDAIALPQGL